MAGENLPYEMVADTDALAEEVQGNFEALASGEGDDEINRLEVWRDQFANFIKRQSGVVSAGAGLSVNITEGYANLNGKWLKIAAQALVITASRDTYIDVTDSGDGINATLTKVEVANNATVGMTLTSGGVRLAKVVSGAASVSSVVQNGLYDPIGNLIYNSSPVGALELNRGLEYADIATQQTSTSTSWADLATAGPTVKVYVPPTGKVKCGLYSSMSNSLATNQRTMMGVDITGATTLTPQNKYTIQQRASTANDIRYGAVFLISGLNEGWTTFKAQYQVQSGTGTWQDRQIWVEPIYA